MPPPNRVVRSVTDIRTHSGTPDQVIVPYKAYMVITVLEMEKFRRETERQNLVTRLKNISARLRRIDTEKTALLNRLKNFRATHASVQRVSKVNRLRSRPADGFKFQY